MTIPRRRLEPLTQRVRARIGKRIGCWWAIELGGARHDRAVRTWDTSPADCPALASLAVVHHDLAGRWLEEEHPVYGMPKNPYHRVDALPSGRHIQVLVNGEPLATTGRPGAHHLLPVWSYPEPLPEAASLAGLTGIPDDDPAVQLLINDASAHHKNAG